MNVDEKRERLKVFCNKKSNCDGCKLECYCELEEYNFNCEYPPVPEFL